LITEVGSIEDLTGPGHTRRLTVQAPRTSDALRVGDSVAVSGVCLTAVEVHPGRSFSADLAAETLARTSLGHLHPGARVNLELPLPAGAPLGGHVVQGHVEGVGRLLSLKPASGAEAGSSAASSAANDWWLRFSLPADLSRYVIEKGSIAVEGISLTVAALHDHEVTIAIIPHTYSATNLSSLPPAALLNIETDVLAKYAEKLQREKHTSSITMERLISEGF